MQRVCQCYQHERGFTMTKFVEGWFLYPFLLAAGEVAAVCAVEEKRVGILHSIAEQVGPLDGPGMDSVRETQWATFATIILMLPHHTLGLMAHADTAKRVFGVHEFSGAWAANYGATWGPILLPHIDRCVVCRSTMRADGQALPSQAIRAELRGPA